AGRGPAAPRRAEPGHRRSRARVAGVLSGTDEIVVPSLFGIEVAASLARVGVAPPAIRSYVDALLAGADVVTLGPRAARRARETAMRWRLRAAAAVYVWLAEPRVGPPCTLDEELSRT